MLHVSPNNLRPDPGHLDRGRLITPLRIDDRMESCWCEYTLKQGYLPYTWEPCQTLHSIVNLSTPDDDTRIYYVL